MQHINDKFPFTTLTQGNLVTTVTCKSLVKGYFKLQGAAKEWILYKETIEAHLCKVLLSFYIWTSLLFKLLHFICNLHVRKEDGSNLNSEYLFFILKNRLFCNKGKQSNGKVMGKSLRYVLLWDMALLDDLESIIYSNLLHCCINLKISKLCFIALFSVTSIDKTVVNNFISDL